MTLKIHATAVAYQGHALVIIGPSGAGKSALALQMMALGVGLIADDRVILTRQGSDVIASCPPQIAGMIEARNVGILNAIPAMPAPVLLAVDLGQVETQRLPEHRSVRWLDCEIPLLWGIKTPYFPASLLQILKTGQRLR